MNDKQCKKCGLNESQSEMPFISSYGLCNFCHSEFMPYITEALKKFIGKTRKGTGAKSWVTRRKHCE